VALSKSTFAYDALAATNATTYFYVVVATNAIGASSPSNEASATPHQLDSLGPTGCTDVGHRDRPGRAQPAGSGTPSSNGEVPVRSYRGYRGTSPGA